MKTTIECSHSKEIVQSCSATTKLQLQHGGIATRLDWIGLVWLGFACFGWTSVRLGEVDTDVSPTTAQIRVFNIRHLQGIQNKF